MRSSSFLFGPHSEAAELRDAIAAIRHSPEIHFRANLATLRAFFGSTDPGRANRLCGGARARYAGRVKARGRGRNWARNVGESDPTYETTIPRAGEYDVSTTNGDDHGPRTPSSRPTKPPVTALVTLEIPMLTGETVPRPATAHPGDAPLDVREAFLFLHADGTSSLFVISEMTGIPLDEVKRAFERLYAKGVVTMDGARAPDEAMMSDRPTVTPPPLPRPGS